MIINDSFCRKNLPKIVCPRVQLDHAMLVPAEEFSVASADDDRSVIIEPPSAHTGPGPVACRLISYELREGQVLMHAETACLIANFPIKSIVLFIV